MKNMTKEDYSNQKRCQWIDTKKIGHLKNDNLKTIATKIVVCHKHVINKIKCSYSKHLFSSLWKNTI